MKEGERERKKKRPRKVFLHKIHKSEKANGSNLQITGIKPAVKRAFKKGWIQSPTTEPSPHPVIKSWLDTFPSGIIQRQRYNPPPHPTNLSWDTPML